MIATLGAIVLVSVGGVDSVVDSCSLVLAAAVAFEDSSASLFASSLARLEGKHMRWGS